MWRPKASSVLDAAGAVSLAGFSVTAVNSDKKTIAI
jgi:hypothetical protein